MSNLNHGRRLVLAVSGLLLLAGLSACVVGPGYEDDGYQDDGVGYGVGYVEPWGYDYGGWGGGGRYRVGPPRGGERRSAPSSHPYHAAPASRSAPSIPTGSRGGHGGNHH